MCTPFESSSLKELLNIGIPAIKISSDNINNIPFLIEASKTKLPVLLSTGMANLKEVGKAVKIFKKTKNPLLLFQCTSNSCNLNHLFFLFSQRCGDLNLLISLEKKFFFNLR